MSELCEAAADKWACAQGHTRLIFERAWSVYEQHAFGRDEVRPLSLESRDNWGALAATMTDALDTMLLMGLDDAHARACAWLYEELPGRIASGADVPFFEVTIRVLGGLLGSLTLRPDERLLRLAVQLGVALLPALAASASGIPYCTVHLATGNATCPLSDFGESIPLSEAGSVQLEFAALAALVGAPRLAALADAALAAIRRLPTIHGLYPSRLRPRSGGPASKDVSLGSGSDSFYETLLKRWLHGGQRTGWMRDMYRDSLDGLRQLVRRSHPSGLAFLARADAAEVGWRPHAALLRDAHVFEHLSCFVPGMLALGAHVGAGSNATAEWALARELLHTCAELYRQQPTGLGPERVTFATMASARATREEWRRRRGDDRRYRAHMRRGQASPGEAPADGTAPSDLIDEDELFQPREHDYSVVDARWPLRPEFVESLYVLWHLEPPSAEREDRRAAYREHGLAMLRAIERHCRTAGGGYAALASTGASGRQLNLLESFFFSETLKYLYLLFTDEAALPVPLRLGETHVLTTEAHLLPVLHDAADDAPTDAVGTATAAQGAAAKSEALVGPNARAPGGTGAASSADGEGSNELSLTMDRERVGIEAQGEQQRQQHGHGMLPLPLPKWWDSDSFLDPMSESSD